MDGWRGPNRRWIVLFALAAICAVTACSGRRASPLPGTAGADAAIHLTVRNDNFLDMVVYVATAGQLVRIGDVRGKRTRRFRLPSTLPAGVQGLQFLVNPIGSDESFLSDAVYPPPGSDVVLAVFPTLSMSSVSVR